MLRGEMIGLRALQDSDIEVFEGTLRQFAWVDGSFADEVILSLLATEWRPAGPDSDR